MKDNKMTITTKLELKEIITKCFYHLKDKGVYSDKELERAYYSDTLKVRAFETILATGLFYIMNDKEFKTDFNYLGNNNNIRLLFDDVMLRQLLREETQ